MKKRKIIFLIVIIFLYSFLMAGCWNYKEIEQLAIVSGVAIDKYGKDKISITFEIVSVQQQQTESTVKPVYIQVTGDTFFDVARNTVSFQGKRLYWSHAKVIIISEDIAIEGISDVLDFISRDAEVEKICGYYYQEGILPAKYLKSNQSWRV